MYFCVVISKKQISDKLQWGFNRNKKNKKHIMAFLTCP